MLHLFLTGGGSPRRGEVMTLTPDRRGGSRLCSGVRCDFQAPGNHYNGAGAVVSLPPLSSELRHAAGTLDFGMKKQCLLFSE
jgi:hypothetical protein